MDSVTTLNKIVASYRGQPNFRNYDAARDKQFCLTGISDLGVELTEEQIDKMFALLTPEQLKTINETLDSVKGWF